MRTMRTMQSEPELMKLMTQIITIDGQFVTLDPNDSARLCIDEVRAVLKFIEGTKRACTEAQNKTVKAEDKLHAIHALTAHLEEMYSNVTSLRIEGPKGVAFVYRCAQGKGYIILQDETPVRQWQQFGMLLDAYIAAKEMAGVE